MKYNAILLLGSALSLVACGGSGGNVATIPAPPVAPTPAPAPPPAPTPTPTPPPPPAPPVDETITLTQDLNVWQNGVDYYKSGDYIAYPNNWGAEYLKIPKSDYSQTVVISKNNFPNKTLISWKYPSTPYGNGDTIFGYPMIAWGKTTLALSGYNTDNSLGNVGNVGALKVKYDVTLSGDTQYMNLMHDVFLYDSKGQIAAEIMYSVYPDQRFYTSWQRPPDTFEFVENGHSYVVMVNKNGGQGSISIVPGDGSKITAGSVDWVALFKLLIDQKAIDPTWIIKGVELGVEVRAGSGSMLVNEFGVTFSLKDQKTSAMVAVTAQSTAQNTTTVSQVTTTSVQQMVSAAVSNPQTPTYGFGQGNVGMGTSMRLSNRLTAGTSSLFYAGNIRGYTMASNLAWRSNNTYAILMGGAGKLRINDTDTSTTFAALETGSRFATKYVAFAPYARLGYTQYHSVTSQSANRPIATPTNLTSMRLSGGVYANLPITKSLLLRVNGEVSNEFLGRAVANAKMNSVAYNAPIDVSGMEYVGSVNLSRKLTNNIYTQMEVGTKKNGQGSNNYANVGVAVPF